MSKPTIEVKGTYKNLNIKVMEDGDTIEFEKIFMEGKAVKSKFQTEGKPEVFNYSCKVKYEGEEVTFFLNEKDHQNFKACGEVGSKIKIDVKEEKYMWKGQKKIRTLLTFTEL